MELRHNEALILNGTFLSNLSELEQHFQQASPGPAWLRLSPELLKECYLLEQSLSDDGPLAMLCQAVIGLLQSVTSGDKTMVRDSFHRLSEHIQPVLLDTSAHEPTGDSPTPALAEIVIPDEAIEMPEATPVLTLGQGAEDLRETASGADESAQPPAVSATRLQLRKALKLAEPVTKVFVLQARASDPALDAAADEGCGALLDEG